ncbi:MAG: AAA family ATPase [Gammaproteobacteria bacterium]
MGLITRSLKLPEHRNFFLFGARNTGKSTLLKNRYGIRGALWIDLLDPALEERYARDPSILQAEVLALESEIQYIIIDEIQKIPKLLDVVHKLIESTEKKFIMTGSSARKLKHGGSNLLAGRAFVYHLYPFTSFELDEAFQLNDALKWGTLPGIFSMTNDEEKTSFLQAYAQTYLKEEIWVEQFIRKLDPFRKFLEVSALSNGKIINVSNIARDVGVDDKTVKEYFSILEDTLIGFFLEPFQHSFRKRLSAKPKFYYFDPGVVRALSRMLSVSLLPSTSAYGEAFEHFIILECLRMAAYYKSEYRFSYLKTKDHAEIDLVVERPGEKILFIEIKSSTDLRKEDVASYSKIVSDFGECEAVCFSRDEKAKCFGEINVLPWQKGIEKYFK